jgi:hypothetical protein
MHPIVNNQLSCSRIWSSQFDIVLCLPPASFAYRLTNQRRKGEGARARAKLSIHTRIWAGSVSLCHNNPAPSLTYKSRLLEWQISVVAAFSPTLSIMSNYEKMDESLVAKHREADSLRTIAFFGVALSTVATLVCVISVPMLYSMSDCIFDYYNSTVTVYRLYATRSIGDAE